ncbi:hypothetical protein IH982_01750 [Patescibacteria group bacterium]|nr:hypothetical protein [Patescibacteria group bacterium]
MTQSLYTTHKTKAPDSFFWFRTTTGAQELYPVAAFLVRNLPVPPLHTPGRYHEWS